MLFNIDFTKMHVFKTVFQFLSTIFSFKFPKKVGICPFFFVFTYFFTYLLRTMFIFILNPKKIDIYPKLKLSFF